MRFAIEQSWLDNGYAIYPITTLLAAAIIRWRIHFFSKKWAERTEYQIEDLLLTYSDNLIPSVLLSSILYYLCYWAPSPVEVVSYVRESVVVLTLILNSTYIGWLVSSLIRLLHSERTIEPRFHPPPRILFHASIVLLAAVGIPMILQVNPSEVAIRLLRIIGILIGTNVLLKITHLSAEQVDCLALRENTGTLSKTERRIRSQAKLTSHAVSGLVLGVAIMMILSEAGIPIALTISVIGVLSLAVGFVLQSLVRDVMRNIFIVPADQIQFGEAAK